MALLRWRRSSSSLREAPQNADAAWKALGVVTDWVKHAESKSAATLAASGVSVTFLYNLTRDLANPSSLIKVAIAVCAVLLVLAIIFGAWSLRPRVWAREQPNSKLYFQHIARRHERKHGPDGYSKEFAELMGDQGKLVSEISNQIWANAHVARQKYQWGSRALTALLLAVVALAFIAVAVSVAKII